MTSSTQQAFGAAVRSRRAELGITLEQLAQASGVSQGALSRIERGTLNTSLHNALAIASSLGSDLDELVSQPTASTVLRHDEGQVFIDPDIGTRRKLLARPSAGVELIHYTLPGKTTTPEFSPHRPRTIETCHVLKGTVTIISDDAELVTLKAGDTAQTPGDHRHRMANPGTTEAALILLMASPR